MALNLKSFSPSTIAKSSEVNDNFSDIQALINAVRPTLYIPVAGTLAVTSNVTTPLKISYNLTFASISLDTPSGSGPSGSAIIVDVNKNGASIFSTRPQINSGAIAGGSGAVFSSDSVVAGDILTVDVDQVGSSTPGADLTIGLVFKY